MAVEDKKRKVKKAKNIVLPKIKGATLPEAELSTSNSVSQTPLEQFQLEYKEKIAKIENDLKGVVDSFEDKIEKKETKTIEILAIFITLFTFISVNVNIFTRVADVYTAVWFMLLMTICSIVLLLFLFLIISIKSNSSWKIWTLLTIIAISLFATVFLTGNSKNWNPQLNPLSNASQK